MRDEPDWTKIWVAWGFALALVLIALIGAVWHYNETIEKAAIGAGLEQRASDRGLIWAARSDKR